MSINTFIKWSLVRYPAVSPLSQHLYPWTEFVMWLARPPGFSTTLSQVLQLFLSILYVTHAWAGWEMKISSISEGGREMKELLWRGRGMRVMVCDSQSPGFDLLFTRCSDLVLIACSSSWALESLFPEQTHQDSSTANSTIYIHTIKPKYKPNHPNNWCQELQSWSFHTI